MNYDTMSVDEWLQTFFEAAVWDGVAFVGNEEVNIDVIKQELRKAVIREASVGRVSIKKDPVDGFPLIDDLAITRCEDLFAWTTYDLILRETP